MTPNRITLILDEETRTAARELAYRYGRSTSEAIRLAIVRHRDAVLGLPAGRRRERRQALERLFALFEGHDARAEVRRLKSEDEGL